MKLRVVSILAILFMSTVAHSASVTYETVKAKSVSVFGNLSTANFTSKLTARSAPGALIGYRVLTSGTTYTPTAGTNSIVVELVGGGGGGGGTTGAASNSAAAGGGGAGGYARKRYENITQTGYTYYVGGFGGGGAAGVNGEVGEATTFTANGVTVTANGGNGGTLAAYGTAVAVVLGGTGGTASNGDINIKGENGGSGIRWSATVVLSGAGGNSYLGSGGACAVNANGTSAANYGSGGSGGSNTSAAKTGGAGSAGVIIVWEYR